MRSATSDDGHGSLWRQLRRVVTFAEGYRWRIAASVTLLLLATAVQLSLPMGIQRLFDQVLEAKSLTTLNLLALMLLALFLARSALSFAGFFWLHVTGDRIVTEIRKRLHRHMHALGLRFHSDQRVGDLLSRLTSDTTAIRNVVTETSVNLTTNALQVIGAIAIMMSMNWRLSLIVLCLSPLTSVLSRTFGPKFQRLGRKIQEQLARASSVAQESLSNIQLVQGFARSEYESRRYDRAVDRVFRVAVDGIRLEALFAALLGFLTSLSTITIFWFGGVEVIEGRLSAGTLVAFLLYSQTITQGFRGFAMEYAGLHGVVGASQRVFEVLDLEPEIRDPVGAVELTNPTPAVRFERVGFGYEAERPVLHDIDFEVRPGQFVALVGPSGAGKSTLLHLIPRFYDCTEGRVLIDGRAVDTFALDSLRDRIAIVSQEVDLFGTTIRENIRYGRLDASDEEVEAAARAANAHHFIQELPLGYDAEVGERGVKLSGGERQRIAIARALLKDTSILILDEATSAVDARSEALIQEALQRLCKGRTVFAIAHRLATVRGADVILTLVEGRIVEQGTHHELLVAGGVYHSLAKNQLMAAEAA
ncbi:MAG: ABC transporter ATP-binding protein [Acidobacteriota bacterium]